MAMMMEFPIDPVLEKDLAERKKDKECRWLKVQIDSEKLVGRGSGKASDEPASDLKGLLSSAEKDEPFYGLVNATDDCEWVVVAYIPDTSKVKARMQYSSSLPAMKKRLGNCCIGDVRVTDLDEITWKTVQEAVDKKKGRVDNSDVMSDMEKAKAEIAKVEKEELKDRVAVMKAGPPMGAPAKLAFAIEDDAKAAVEALAAGDATVVILKNENERFALEEKVTGATTIEEVAKKLGKESRFVVYSHKHEDEKKVLFIYYASDQCPVKKRMTYASSKSACVQAVTAAGAEPVKRLEFSEADDFTTKALDEALAPTPDEDEPEEAPKPKAPMNRGPRMLI